MRPPSTKSAPLSPVLKISQVAKLAGWSRARMHRHLIALNAQLGGLLLHKKIGPKGKPRWTVTLKALEMAAPEWFLDPQSVQRTVEKHSDELLDLRQQVRTLSAMNEMQIEKIAQLNEQVKALEARAA